MKIKYIIGAISFAAMGFLSAPKAMAQSLPVLETPVDARAAAMGGVSLTHTDRSYLYVNPASIFQTDKKLTVSASGLLFPKMNMVEGRLLNGMATAGWKFHNRHVVYAGFRYQGGLTLPSVKDQFGTPGKKVSPFDWTADLGYAFRFNDQLSAFASGSFVQSYTGRTAMTGTFSLGANYFMSFNNSAAKYLNIAARVSDLGAPISFSSKDAFALPSRAELTGDFGSAFSENRELNLTLGGRYSFLASKPLYQANIGAEYVIFKMVSLRAGYQYGSQSTSAWTGGIGVKFYNFKLDFAAIKGLGEFDTKRMMVSLSFDY